MTRSHSRAMAALLALAAIAACRSGGAPAAAPAAVPAAVAANAAPAAVPAAPARRGYTEADVRFVQGMIAHHGQALEMTALVPGRASRPELRLLAERIDVSQRDEIALMRRWLEQRGEEVPDVPALRSGQAAAHEAHDSTHQAMRADSPHAAHEAMAGHHELMPGMLTPEEMARLAAAAGAGFDRLFLEDMIHHHEGALAMVAQLLATPGAAQEPELFRFASDVDADQRAEIARMRALLRAIESSPSPGAPRR
ncbi:MAG TPA: DUF305 domain-containing protein [Gemmatimonadaceae bacterium]|nr:DUF305 domain-containing protein [Gemmatimonadaceae bacterium]